MNRHTVDDLTLRQNGDGSLSGPLLLVDRDPLGAPTVAGQEVERVGHLVDDGGVDQLAAVVLVDEHHHHPRLHVGRARVVALGLRVTGLAQIGKDSIVCVRLLLTRNLQRLVDADSCTESHFNAIVTARYMYMPWPCKVKYR